MSKIQNLEAYHTELPVLLDAIFEAYKDDFRDYTVSSVRRRVALAMERLHFDTLPELTQAVLQDPQVYQHLLQYLTVPTSEMFRDPSYYRALREHVLPVLRTYPSIKIWIAGCSTGEEAYSIAIVLKEEGLLDRSIIYATDLNPQNLQRAEAGIYGLDQMKAYTQNYQKAGGKAAFSDYYHTAYNRAIFDQRLRGNMVFADHSLATDSVFAEVQFISCRNVLIYFNRTLQDRVFKLFFESLSHRGFLGLGAKETLRFSCLSDYFEEVEPRERIYREKRKA